MQKSYINFCVNNQPCGVLIYDPSHKGCMKAMLELLTENNLVVN
jgi:hypothetical protein